MNPTISVIVPMYNCSSSMDRTLRCLREQSYKNLEIILEKMQDFQRQDCSEYIKRAGYAIETTTCSIEETCFK